MLRLVWCHRRLCGGRLGLLIAAHLLCQVHSLLVHAVQVDYHRRHGAAPVNAATH
jgi:hypothetical protein